RVEVGAAIIERIFHASFHAFQVIFVAGMVVELELHVFPLVTSDVIASGIYREETKNRRLSLVMEVTSPVFRPFFLQISWDDRDLVGTGADCGVEVDPVGFRRNIITL